MTILVTGATGNVGHNVVDQLAKRGADVRALVRDPAKADFPAGVAVVKGDLLDVGEFRGILRRAGLKMSEADVQSIISYLDRDASTALAAWATASTCGRRRW